MRPYKRQRDDHLPLEERSVLNAAGNWISASRHLAAWVLAAALAVSTLVATVTNSALQWSIISHYLFAPVILAGLCATILITAGSAFIGVCGGLLIALMRLSDLKLLRSLAVAYLIIFRSVPLLVQILFWYNLASFYPVIGVSIPFTSVSFFASTNDVITPLAACLLAIGLNQAAYSAETIRGGILGVPAGQIDAAVALGMTRAGVFRRVVAPQGLRLILPATGNDLISLMKATSLVSVIGVGDLMTRAQSIYAVNYEIIPLLVVASLWYLALTGTLSIFQIFLESKASLGQGRRVKKSDYKSTFFRRASISLNASAHTGQVATGDRL